MIKKINKNNSNSKNERKNDNNKRKLNLIDDKKDW